MDGYPDRWRSRDAGKTWQVVSSKAMPVGRERQEQWWEGLGETPGRIWVGGARRKVMKTLV